MDLNLLPDEVQIVKDLARRFGVSQAAIARALVREGIGRVQRTGSFTVELHPETA